ncbi:MAG: DNA polymerase III subunit beta [Immundisolibacter sp.]|uniref:DNA polymerase III subunit beta n=1 Tax=Immundisolibacter sp. TaxID=1934948 RepID=UPI0019BC1462|nr:DNA polymerase III subunit beta [Immundisolibacter sp.]MBC7160789.1 DNA polymerase III subunit beta [Immundisolibacter sp.]
MKISVERNQLLTPLQVAHAVVERRQTLPILANVLLTATEHGFRLSATDLEVELSVPGTLDKCVAPGATTLPARKLLDLCRALPDGTLLTIDASGDRATVRAGRSRFSLSILPAAEFPGIDVTADELVLELPQRDLRRAIEATHFAMAQQDVRYYLNGMLFEINAGKVRLVATDGHRMAITELPLELAPELNRRIIVPRKTVIEALRLLSDDESPARLCVGVDHLTLSAADIVFKSKVIDGSFPDYERVVPRNQDKVLDIDRLALRDALNRVAIFANEKYRSVRLQLEPNLLRLSANNAENEDAEDELEVDYAGASLEIGFNVSYLIDVLTALRSESVRLHLSDPGSSCLLTEPAGGFNRYVIMPMRL